MRFDYPLSLRRLILGDEARTRVRPGPRLGSAGFGVSLPGSWWMCGAVVPGTVARWGWLKGKSELSSAGHRDGGVLLSPVPHL